MHLQGFRFFKVCTYHSYNYVLDKVHLPSFRRLLVLKTVLLLHATIHNSLHRMTVLLKRNLFPFSEWWSDITCQDTRCSSVLWGLSCSSYYEVDQKILFFAAPHLEAEREAGGWPKPFHVVYFFVLGLLVTHKKPCFLTISRKCEGSRADVAWKQQSSGSNSETENDDNKHTRLSDHPSLLLP